MRPVALLDRDGTINVKAAEGAYVTRAEDVVLIPGAAAAIRRLNDAGVPVAIVTNQRGIARGLMTEADLALVNARLAELLAEEAGARVDLWLHCPHEAGSCDCRKPAPGMLLEALETLGGDAAQSIMVGDAESDIEAGRAAGVPTFAVAGETTLLADGTDAWLRSVTTTAGD